MQLKLAKPKITISETVTSECKRKCIFLFYFSVYRGRATTISSNYGATLRKTMAHKNAEKHMAVSRSVIIYVIVFSLCWLPQRITNLLFDLEVGYNIL